jgi:hypothetical protein
LKKDSNPHEKCRLTHSEFDDITQRLEESLSGPISLLKDALSSKENLIALREKVDEACEKLTMKVNILGFQEQKSSSMQPSIVTDVYKIEIPEVSKKGYLLLKYNKSKNLKVETESSYLIDKIKLVVNNKGKIVLVSNSLTVMIQYSMFKATDENSIEVDSDDGYFYQDGQNKSEDQIAHEALLKKSE